MWEISGLNYQPSIFHLQCKTTETIQTFKSEGAEPEEYVAHIVGCILFFSWVVYTFGRHRYSEQNLYVMQ